MGSSQSSERARRQRPAQPAPPPPPVYSNLPPYAPPPVYPTAPGQFPPPQVPPPPGPYFGNNQLPPQPYQVIYRPPPPVPVQPPHYLQQQFGQPPRPVQTQECQTTATIRNQVNLNKQTLALQPTSQPGVYNISFKFDASAPCRVTTFVCAREDVRRSCKITSPSPPAPAVSYPKGLSHAFPSPSAATSSAHVVNTMQFPARDLTTPSNESYPVIIRLESLYEDAAAAGTAAAPGSGPSSAGRSLESLEVGCELPSWVQAQTTYAQLVKEDDGAWGLRVIKQKIWVKGVAYELKEIYGMEAGKPSGNADESFEDVDGNECVICMSAPRDTTALPCRHMCMCHGCASALKTQTNKCPICRNEIESLLHIKIKNNHVAPAAAGSQAPA
ncbi:hypothetical protein Agub_g1822 [Astrephomene gubernaculifera]|uniref:RING-type E3 ubiquitin transferase n=1 Tax=Astrephomene gubernaculifera TaxID=47775 RepID=A0AAD3DGK2_9CHLO|nr:hypothetical protein Agub_g1822 [Astrephomene gubernaculifera]